MTKDAEAIQELMEAERLATPGPWSSSGVTIADNGPCHTKVAITWRRSWKTGKGTEAGVRNAAFIAAARNAVPILLNLIRAQAVEIEKLEADNVSKTKLLRAICDDMECVSECDEHAHDRLCPVANEGQAFVLLRERIAELERERDGWKQRALGWNQEATDNEIARAEAADELTTLRERVKRVPHISRSGVAFWEPLLETVELQSMNQNHDAGRCAAHGGACLFIEPEPEGASDVSSSPQGGGIEARQKPSLPTCSNCGEALCPRKERCQNTNHVHGTAAHHIKDGGTANDACKREWCHLCRGTGKLLSMEDCQQKPLPAIPTGECDRCKGTGWITPLSPGPLEAP